MNWEYYENNIKNNNKLDADHMILGIDLGTTHSVISFWNYQTNQPETIDVSHGFGKIPMPSVIQYRHEEQEEEEWVIGEEAYRSMKIFPETTINSIKRKMGTRETIRLGGVDYLPEALSSKILLALIEQVLQLNPKAVIAGVVVSVPYDFEDVAKKATMRACQIAGFKDSLICLIEEPKAAALAYSFRQPLKHKEKMMVFDFGGGTLDITIFEVLLQEDNTYALKVLSEGGEAHHGGDQVDEYLFKEMMTIVQETTGQASSMMTIENQTELMLRARETKERLSGVKKYRIPFTFCIPPFMKEITRSDLETLIESFRIKTKQLVKRTLLDAYQGEIKAQDIDKILLEGGASQMPWVKEMLVEIFGDEDKICRSPSPALDISVGATYYAAMKLGLLKHPDITTLDKNIIFEVPVPHDIGFLVDYGQDKGFYSMIRRGTPYVLAKKAQVFTLTGENTEDMSKLSITVLERMKKGDSLKDCRLIGEVNIEGLPIRPTGKTNLKVTLMVEEEGGLVKGTVEDLGFLDQFKSSGFKTSFIPDRNIGR
jgi:molecular chaperone DnaK